MEVKINREIRNYTEAMFFGLSLRQFIFSVCACAVAVGLYFLLKSYVGTETVSWMCILGAAPFAALGFIKYNGMTVATGIKAAVKATIAAVKAIIAAIKALIAAIAAGGWVAVVVIIVICLIALLLGSVFGIFFSGEDRGTGMTMQTVVQEINTEYDTKLQAEKDAVSYDVLEMSGSRAVWKDVLAVYAVKTNTDQDNPQEVATMDDSKKQILTDIFWKMNQITSRTESKTETQITETDDGHGNIVQTETTVTHTYLYITVSHNTVDEMAAQYGFNQEQKDYLAELLKDENNSMWSAVLYGISYSDGESDHVGIVEKAENGTVYTVEGNSGDSCRINQYSVGNHQIYGYGVPQY